MEATSTGWCASLVIANPQILANGGRRRRLRSVSVRHPRRSRTLLLARSVAPESWSSAADIVEFASRDADPGGDAGVFLWSASPRPRSTRRGAGPSWPSSTPTPSGAYHFRSPKTPLRPVHSLRTSWVRRAMWTSPIASADTNLLGDQHGQGREPLARCLGPQQRGADARHGFAAGARSSSRSCGCRSTRRATPAPLLAALAPRRGEATVARRDRRPQRGVQAVLAGRPSAPESTGRDGRSARACLELNTPYMILRQPRRCSYCHTPLTAALPRMAGPRGPPDGLSLSAATPPVTSA